MRGVGECRYVYWAIPTYRARVGVGMGSSSTVVEIDVGGRDMISPILHTFQGSTYLEQSLDPETSSL